MKTRKDIIQDIDKIWVSHFARFDKKDFDKTRTYKRSLSSRIASYIMKVPCCGHSCCCSLGKL